MFIRSELQALRENDAPQRQAQTALGSVLAAWRDSHLGAAVDNAVAAYDRGDSIEFLAPLSGLFVPGSASAERLAKSFVSQFIGPLLSHHWGQVPVPSKLDDSVATIVVSAAGNSALCLQAIDGTRLRGHDHARTARFAAGETHDRVITGTGQARLVELAAERGDNAKLRITPLALAPGSVSRRDGARQSLLIEAAESAMVVLRLQRRPPMGTVSREFNLADGTLVHQAVGNARESRFELAATLLGCMGRSDAAPLLAAMAEEQGGQSLRWQSLRQCLGLDTAEGFAALSRIAARQNDSLSAPAQALRGQLIATHPDLERLV